MPRHWRVKQAGRAGFWTAVALTSVFIATGTPRAEFRPFDAVEVPVDRLVENLQSLLEKWPDDVQLRINLARTHMMAFVLKSSAVAVPRGHETAGPVQPLEQPNVLPKEHSTADPAKLETARDHVARAIVEYEKAISLAPDNPVARLGYAWALQSSGAKDKAIEAYRAAIRVSWPADSDSTRPHMMGWQTITEEAAKYLIPLLDPVKDRDEIATLKAYPARLQPLKRAITPVAVPLRDGMTAFDVVDATAHVRFDLDGSGIPKPWTWIAKDAGWLVMDLHGHRAITSGLQLFGNVTFWLFWDNGYDAMRALDDDGDGTLRGAELTGLAIWRDANGDGISDAGEVRSLADWKIVELSCAYVRDARHPDEIVMSPAGVRFSSGTTRPTFDVVLHQWPLK